jgi:hypothetical protein
VSISGKWPEGCDLLVIPAGPVSYLDLLTATIFLIDQPALILTHTLILLDQTLKRRHFPHAKPKAARPPGRARSFDNNWWEHLEPELEFMWFRARDLVGRDVIRPGRAEEWRLKWLVKFANQTRKDLNQLNEEQLTDLRIEIARFCSIDGRERVGLNYKREDMLSPSGPFFFSRRKLANLAAELRADIKRALRGERLGPVSIKRSVQYDDKETVGYEFFAGKPVVLLRWVLQTLILRSASRIHTCITDGCGRLFIKVKRQVRCSDKCAQRKYSQDYRNDEQNRDKIRESRHRSYVKEVKNKKGYKAARAVKRRPRPPLNAPAKSPIR